MKLIILLVSLLAVQEVRAESVGLHVNSLQGLNKAQCATLLKAYRKVDRPSIALLWGTFTRPGYDCLKTFLKRYPNSHTHIYLSNQTCLRPPRYCETRKEVFSLRDYANRVRQIVEYFNKHAAETTSVSLAYGLEDDWSTREYKEIKSVVDPLLPMGWITVRNPNSRDANYRPSLDSLIELHPIESKFRGRACFFSNDGVDLDFGGRYRPLKNHISISSMLRSLRQKKRDCRRAFLWWNNQGIEGDHFIPPSRRTFRIYPEVVRHVNLILRRLEK